MPLLITQYFSGPVLGEQRKTESDLTHQNSQYSGEMGLQITITNTEKGDLMLHEGMGNLPCTEVGGVNSACTFQRRLQKKDTS